VRFGRTVPEGHLPVYSVDTEEEARRILVLACQTNTDGEFVAKELAEEQTLQNLYAFGDRLKDVHDKLLAIDRGRGQP